MSVGSFLELYTAVFGWLMYDRIWEVLTKTGIAYLPFIGVLVKNFAEPYQSQETKDASTTSIKRMEMDIVAMLTVVVLAASPFFDLTVGGQTFTRPCGSGAVAGGATGKTYDTQFTTTTLGGSTAKVPIWWYGVMALSGGVNDAIISAIPCTIDIRKMEYGLANSRISDPQIRRQTQLFYNDCYKPALAKFMDNQDSLPASYRKDDIQWPGSTYFLNTPGYYDTYRVTQEISGFPYNAARDTEYSTGFIPVNGRPVCKEWWTDAGNGLRQNLISQVEPSTWATFRTNVPAMVGGVTTAQAEDIALQTLFTQDQTALTALSNNESIADNDGLKGFVGGVYNRFAGQLGAWLESSTFYPKMYMVRVAAPIIQALILMMFYLLLPFAIIFSSYSIGTALFLSIILFAIKFWTVLWAIAFWLDNNLLEALKPGYWFEFQHTSTNVVDDIINFTTGMMFIALPLLWFALLGWAGYKVGNAINSVTDKGYSAAGRAGERGGDQIRKTGGRGKTV